MTKIIEFLYLGGWDTVTADFIEDLAIRQILSLDILPPTLPKTNVNIEHKFIQISDEEESLLLPHLPEITDWIINNINNNQTTLVHCRHGVSRSATVVVATLMKLWSADLDTCLVFVKNKRPQVEPNIGFHRQLLLWQNLGCVLDQSNINYRLFLHLHGTLIPKEVSPGDSEFGYKCGKCRRILFHSGDLVPHEGSWWEGVDQSKACAQGLSVLPHVWMKKSAGSRLNCGFCSQKLGSMSPEASDKFRVGMSSCDTPCPCSARVSRGIIVNPAKVDKFKPLRHPLSLLRQRLKGHYSQPSQGG